MPDEIYAIEGSSFSIGGPLAQKPTAFVAADFAGQTWQEVDPWTTVGTSGLGTREMTSSPTINRDVPVITAGSNNPGTYELTFLWKETDEGQRDMRAAYALKSHHAFRIEHATGELEYFIGIVTALQRVGGEAGPGTPAKLQASIAIGCTPVLVAAP